jgi:hypothetical protein
MLAFLIVGAYVVGVETMSIIAFLRMPINQAWPYVQTLHAPLDEMVMLAFTGYFVSNVSEKKNGNSPT